MSGNPEVDTREILTWTEGALGRIRLNRPRALNALTLPMIEALAEAFDRFGTADNVAAIAIDGSGARGLCAGADVRAVRAGALDGSADPVDFWRTEYALIASLIDPPKPVVALMDGIVMGAGVGLSIYSALRLVTPSTRLAMPETGIGLFPDVGALFALSRAPGAIGTHLAMTGSTCAGADAIACGMADALVEEPMRDDVLARLAAGTPVAELYTEITGTAGTLPHAPLADATWIAECYEGDDPLTIHDWLRSNPHPEAQAAAELMETRSPLSVAVTLAALRKAAEAPDVAAVIDTDLQIAEALMAHPDFNEGVRAVLVDKDGSPRWEHPDLASVDPELVARIVG